MAEEAIKQKLYRAKKRISDILERSGYTVMVLDNHIFHLEAIREKEIRKIRVAIDEIRKEDEDLVRNCELPIICTKEIWCKKSGGRHFEIKKI